MTGQEIANLLMEKGRVTNDVYYSIYYVLTLSPEHEKYDNEFFATLSYNSTIVFLGDILNYPQYYTSSIYEINEEDLDSIKQDYDSMELLDYPNEYCDIDTEEIELEIEENFMTSRYLASNSESE